MSVTVTLSDPIGERLQTQADKIHLPLDTLVEQMLIDSLPVYETNGFHPIDDQPTDEDFPTLEEIVAMIKATPPNPNAIKPGEKFGDMAYIQSVPRARQNLVEWGRLRLTFLFHPIEQDDAELAATLQLGLRRRGRQLHTVDALIAAVALRYNLTLLTTDKDFQAVVGLARDNWLTA